MRRALLSNARAARRLELAVSYAARRPWAPGPRRLFRWASAALAPLRRRVVLSVRVVGKAGSRRLNARYRRKDKPTIVLTCAGPGRAADGRYYLGDLVICAGVVAEEAVALGKSLEAHWAHMIVHGALHLQGFDHEIPADAARMAVREAQILDRLGFSEPYR